MTRNLRTRYVLSVLLPLPILLGQYSSSLFASQSITVIVKDHKGNAIENFHYDESALFFNWSPQIYVRSNGQEDFLADLSLSRFAGHSSYEPHTYNMATPKVLVEVLRGNETIAYGSLDQQSTFPVDGAGIYTIRCSTTIQVDGIIDVENTGSPIGGTIVPPTRHEGTDDRGRYEFYRIEMFDNAGQLAYRYYKRYTYNIVLTTLTHVSPGETDTALVCFPIDPQALGQLA